MDVYQSVLLCPVVLNNYLWKKEKRWGAVKRAEKKLNRKMNRSLKGGCGRRENKRQGYRKGIKGSVDDGRTVQERRRRKSSTGGIKW